MILESIVTTSGLDGEANIAPMGPDVNESYSTITLKPFRTSLTFSNLRDTGVAVVHVTDDVELIACSAIGKVDPTGLIERVLTRWVKLVDCCRWFAVEVESWSDDPHTGVEMRPLAFCKIVHRGEQRPMFGLCRAKYAVVEAAILATRIDMLGRDEVIRQMIPLRTLVEKTGGPAEHRAWRVLETFTHG
jgi:uncharacterized protein